jgi:hypothetical protein
VRGRPLSYRRRRRLVVLVVVAIVAGVVTAAALVLPHGQKPDHSVSAVSPASIAPQKEPPQVRLTKGDRAALRSTVALFVATAVARHHPERAWPIIAPVLREGMTRRQWRTGDIPVVPYPAKSILLLNVQSLEKRSALIEVLLASPPEANLVRKTFQIQLQRSAHAPNGWAVAAWVPEGVSESQVTADQRRADAAVGYHPAQVSSIWIVVLFGLLVGALVLIPAGHFGREAYRNRRAEAEYRASQAERGL